MGRDKHTHILFKITDCIIFCGVSELVLRGRNESEHIFMVLLAFVGSLNAAVPAACYCD